MRAHDDKSSGLLSAALLAAVVSLAGLAGAVKIAQTAVAFGPAVGDVIRFDPNSRMPVDESTQIDAKQSNARGCVLDMDTIHRSGGSLVIEERLPGAADTPRYVVHWAGSRTAAGAHNCGRQADLMLDDSNLDVLAMAAGGWGASHKHVQPNDIWG
ncbi:MAG TPA: hypothetical protein VME47_14640, partial [Acetobacteraceae bacterium]|nr:hypothetical protein [Acetobacteraceae bacterium]